MLPDRQPAYVQSWIYVFGVASLAAFLYVLASGVVLASRARPGGTCPPTGPLRELDAPVECRAVLRLHGHPPVGQVLHGRLARASGRLTWMTGAVAFIGSIGTAFTGYLVADELRLAVDLDPGEGRAELRRRRRRVQRAQHRPDAAVARRCCFPLVVGVLVIMHVMLVRRHGVVPPFDAMPPATPRRTRSRGHDARCRVGPARDDARRPPIPDAALRPRQGVHVALARRRPAESWCWRPCSPHRRQAR